MPYAMTPLPHCERKLCATLPRVKGNRASGPTRRFIVILQVDKGLADVPGPVRYDPWTPRTVTESSWYDRTVRGQPGLGPVTGQARPRYPRPRRGSDCRHP